MADFFIRRPTVAIVAAIVITLLPGGAAAPVHRAVSRAVAADDPGRNDLPGCLAELVEQSVATPIEQQVNGVDNMIYMKSLNTSDGRMPLDISFQVGMNRDMANVLGADPGPAGSSRAGPRRRNEAGGARQRSRT